MSKTAPMSFRLSQEMKDKLQDLATADRRSLTNYILLVLERHIEALEQQEKPTQVRRIDHHAPF